MGWTTPTDRSTSYVVTSTDWNVIEDDLTFLYGDTGWTNVSVFTNSWASAGAGNVPRFALIGRVVYLNGMVTGGTINTAAFTLPAGYRPSQLQRFGNAFNAAFGQLTVNPAGNVIPAVGATTNVAIDCSFTVI